MGQDFDKITEIDHVPVRVGTPFFSLVVEAIGVAVLTITEKGMNNSVGQRVDG